MTIPDRTNWRHLSALAFIAAAGVTGFGHVTKAADPLAPIPDLTAPAPAKTVAPSASQATQLPPGAAPAMPPALTPEPAPVAGAPGSVSDIGKAVNQQVAKNAATAAALPDVGGGMNAPTPMVNANGMMPGPVVGTANQPIKPSAGAGPAAPDIYYDTAGPVPGGPLSSSVGPRKVNPQQEPGSQFVIVEKEEGPGGRESQLVAADRAIKLGDYDAAADMYDTLYAKYPKDARVLMGRAVAYQNTGRAETAIKMYSALIDIDPQNVDAQVNMLGLMSKQYPEVALRRLINLHDKYPNDATVAAQIGVTAAQEGQFDDALRFLQIAASIQPDNAQHQFNLAIIADKSGHKDEAVKYYQQALETDAVYGGSHSIPRDKVYDRLAALRQQ